MPARARARRPAARSATAVLPRRRLRVPGGIGTAVRALAPSRRSLAVGLGILAVAFSAYAIARETSIFALEGVDVRGGSAKVDGQVREALAPLLGKSLVGLDGGVAIRRVEALPTVVSATYDRAFPHTLRITIVPEQPAAVLRQSTRAWLVSRRGRVMQRLDARADPSLPHIWLGSAVKVGMGEVLSPADGGAAAKALGLAGAFARRVATAALVNGAVVFHLRSGIELVLGSASDVSLKVAVATQALVVLPSGSRFLDVSVPGRPVAGTRLPQLQPSSRGRV